MKNLQLVVPDATAARHELLDRGVQVSELTVMTDADGGTFFGFQDPDGNSWGPQMTSAVSEVNERSSYVLERRWHGGRDACWRTPRRVQ